MSQIRLSFPNSTPDQIADALFRYGCVFLKDFTSPQKIAALRADLAPFYGADVREVFTQEMAAHQRQGFVEHLCDPRHEALLARLFPIGSHAAFDMHSRRMSPMAHRRAGFETPLNWHVDAVFTKLEFGVNFWTPLTPCGVDAPGLVVIPASFEEVLPYLGYDGAVRPNKGPPDYLFEYFQPPVTASARGDVHASQRIRQTFRGREWSPAFSLGDAMLLTTYTLHATYCTPAMKNTRENVELRFYGSEGLLDILAAHRAIAAGGPLATAAQ